MAEMDPERARAVFRTWLRALAADPDAAVAASLAYEDLTADSRDAWLDAVEEDAKGMAIPGLALYAPLLAVENDEPRRLRMMKALEGTTMPAASIRAWQGRVNANERAAVVMAPVYLEFVEVLGARCDDQGFVEIVHVPLAHANDRLPDLGAELEPASAADVVEELALAVLAHDRSGRPRPSAAHALVRYLTPCIS